MVVFRNENLYHHKNVIDIHINVQHKYNLQRNAAKYKIESNSTIYSCESDI